MWVRCRRPLGDLFQGRLSPWKVEHQPHLRIWAGLEWERRAVLIEELWCSYAISLIQPSVSLPLSICFAFSPFVLLLHMYSWSLLYQYWIPRPCPPTCLPWNALQGRTSRKPLTHPASHLVNWRSDQALFFSSFLSHPPWCHRAPNREGNLWTILKRIIWNSIRSSVNVIELRKHSER